MLLRGCMLCSKVKATVHKGGVTSTQKLSIAHGVSDFIRFHFPEVNKLKKLAPSQAESQLTTYVVGWRTFYNYCGYIRNETSFKNLFRFDC